MAIRRGLTMINSELTAEYNADALDYQVAEAAEQELNAIDYINNQKQ